MTEINNRIEVAEQVRFVGLVRGILRNNRLVFDEDYIEAYRQICQLMPDYSALKRFWKMVKILDNGCWEWLGKTQNLGYGQFHLGRKLVLAHRFAYEAFVGEIPRDLETDHLCRNRKCVNPAHLEMVTHSENNRRGDCGLHTALKNWAKTHCAKGHPYNEENTYYWRGWRKCRICSREANKRWRVKNERLPRTYCAPGNPRVG